MISDSESTASSLTLENVSAFAQSADFKPPKLGVFRPLQAFALSFAVIWLVVALLVSRLLIQDQLKESLHTINNHVMGEAGHLVKALSQNLYRAEQLSKTLSFDQSVITLAEYGKKNSNEYKKREAVDRSQYLLNMPGANRVDTLFEQLASNVDLHQILLLDETGYCIGSSRSREPDGCLGTDYHTREYFNKAKSEGSGRQFAIGRVVPVPSFFFSTAIKKEGIFLGAVIVRQDMQQIAGFINHQKTLTFITGTQGIILSSSREELTYKYIGDEFAPRMEPKEVQATFHREKIESLHMVQVELPSTNLPFVALDGKTYILGQSSVEGGDFNIFILENIDPILRSYYNSWNLAITIVILGLLLILMIERNLNHNQHRIAHLNALSEANKNLALLTDELYELSVTDALTGISNRRFFNDRLEHEINRNQRRKSSSANNNATSTNLTLLIIDIDNFKKINDTFGHPAGDQAIRAMANICAEAVRQYDYVGRIGGEEFAILLTDINTEQAIEIAERIRSQCEHHLIHFNGIDFNQTCSIGIATFEENDSADSLLSKADSALYTAKRDGRNRFFIQ